MQRLEFTKDVFKTLQQYVSEDRALNALNTSICMSATSAIMADILQQHSHRSLQLSVDTFALTPAMCRIICDADKSCEVLQILIVSKIVTCTLSGNAASENTAAQAPDDTEVVLQTRLCDFSKMINRAERVIQSTEAFMLQMA